MALPSFDLGKSYRRYGQRWHRLCEWVSAGRVAWHQDFWALRGVSFAVASGESVGIIGLNGAGKTTLLKILTGTTQPTEGHVEIAGRVASLLELGIGFHPDFSGRQNAVMAGQLMGIPVQDLAALMPDIEAFAEIGQYIDQPVRTYSTGMAVRLAFAVATAARPEVLIIDETLSVGDAYFQHKCIRRIKEFQRSGTTILFVSHDPTAVKTLCGRALLLEGGRLIQDGPPDRVLDYYNAMIAKREANREILQAEVAGQAEDNAFRHVRGSHRRGGSTRRRRTARARVHRRRAWTGQGQDRVHLAGGRPDDRNPHPRPPRQRRVWHEQLLRRADRGRVRARR